MFTTAENDGITVRQTVARTTVVTFDRYAMWFMPLEEKGTIIRSVSKPSCPFDTTTTDPGAEYNL